MPVPGFMKLAARRGALLGLFALLSATAASPVSSQCSRWIDGPLSAGASSPNGPVNAVLTWDPDGAGSRPELLIVAGAFTSINGVEVSNIASWDGTVWRDLAGGVNGPIRALTIYQGALVAAGSFTSAGGVPTTYVARYNDLYWSPMNNGMFGGSSVYALAVHGGQLFSGGDFERFTRRWDAPSSTWVSFASSLNATVYALASYGSYLYAGGDFQSDGFDSMPHIARWDGFSWGAVEDYTGGLDGPVYALTVYNGLLAVGGAFSHYDNSWIPQSWCVIWDGGNWQSMDCGNPCTLRGPVYALTVYDGWLHAGGEFHEGSSGFDARRVARWTGSTWYNLSTGVGTASASGEAVYGMAEYRGELFAGGTFSTPAANLVRWNGTSWSDGNAPVVVNALAAYGTRMALAGSFAHYFPEGESYHIAVWNGLKLERLGSGTDAPVNALVGWSEGGADPKNRLVVGGQFSSAGGLTANRVALWTESTNFFTSGWSTMGAGFNGDVLALGRFASSTVAGGAFTASGAVGVNNVARFVGTAWQPMGSGMNGPVFALKGYSVTPSSSVMIAGGSFTQANGSAALCIASWVSRSEMPDTPWSPLGSGLNGAVYAIERHAGSIYAGGAFTTSGSGTPLSHVAQYTGGNWVAVGVGLPGTVYALRSEGGILYAAGDFPGRVVRFTGGAWQFVDGGANSTARALAGFHSEMFAGGNFTQVRDYTVDVAGAARFLTTGAPWIALQPFPQTVAEGEDARFTVEPAAGYETASCVWRRDGVPLADGPTGNGSTILGATTRDLRVLAAAAADTGSYDCLVTNTCGNAASPAASLVVTTQSGVPSDSGAARLALAVMPNPFRGTAVIQFELPEAAEVEVRIYDVSGRPVRSLIPRFMAAGSQRLAWEGHDDHGRTLPSGIYYLRLRTADVSVTRRLALLR